MEIPKELVPLIEAEVRRWLPKLLSDEDVQAISARVFEKMRDKTDYAPLRHTHDVKDVQGIDTLRSGLSKEGHTHFPDEVQGLSELIGKAVSSIEVPTDYASKGHLHDLSELKGSLPISRIQDGGKLLIGLEKIKELEGHDHQDIRKDIASLEKKIESIPACVPYDDAELRNLILSIQKEAQTVRVPKSVPVEISISPVPAPSVTVKGAYIVLGADPSQVSVKDASGESGTAKITARGDKFLVRPSFGKEPVQPITYVFGPSVPPPTLCSIGTSTESETN